MIALFETQLPDSSQAFFPLGPRGEELAVGGSQKPKEREKIRRSYLWPMSRKLRASW